MKYVTLLFACPCILRRGVKYGLGSRPSGNPSSRAGTATPKGWSSATPTGSSDLLGRLRRADLPGRLLVERPRTLAEAPPDRLQRRGEVGETRHVGARGRSCQRQVLPFFAGNDIHEGETGGIGVAVADSPAGPFRDALGKPLIDSIVNGAQPIDQFVFRDDDGSYPYYGGWGHCNMVRLSPDLLRIVPFDDGTPLQGGHPRRITPRGRSCSGTAENITSCGRKGAGRAPITASPTPSPTRPSGPFRTHRQDPRTRPGNRPRRRAPLRHTGSGAGRMVIVYHRRPLDETAASSRETCIDPHVFRCRGAHRPGQDDPRGRRSPPHSRCRQGAVNLSRNREPSTTKIPVRQHCRTGILVPAGTYGERIRRHSPSRSESQRTSESFGTRPCI